MLAWPNLGNNDVDANHMLNLWINNKTDFLIQRQIDTDDILISFHELHQSCSFGEVLMVDLQSLIYTVELCYGHELWTS